LESDVPALDGETSKPEGKSNAWILVFVFAFLAMVADGADMMFLSYSLTSVTREFSLTSVQAGSLGSLTLAGMAIGGIIGGWTGDRFGRVRSVVYTIIIFSVGTIVVGMTQSYVQFAVARFVSSLGIGALYVLCNTLVAESVPTERRTTILGALQAGWSVGYLLATLLAGWIIPTFGWRYLFYVAGFPVILALLIQMFVQEPAAWIESRRAQKDHANTAEGSDSDGTFSAIWADPKHRRMFLLWALTAGFLQFAYYGVNNWLPTYLEKEMNLKFDSMTGYLVGTYVAMIAGKVIAGFLADRFGRRAVFSIGAVGSAIFIPVMVLYGSTANISYLLVAFGFIYGLPYGVNATYMTESFEAKIRATAVGGAYNIGRLGAAVAPIIIGYLASTGSIGLGFLVMGAAYFICGIIPLIFIPEKLYDPQRN
jgi:AAHS family cis,cis-muconate transporter-like MFS transporter